MRHVAGLARLREGLLRFAGFWLCIVPSAAAADDQDHVVGQDLVAVAIVRDGRAVVLATPGRSVDGRRWRFRSFDTSDLPQPVSLAVLSTSATKLLLQTASGAALVFDLTRQERQHAPLQYVSPRNLSSDGSPSADHAHRLPNQRFVTIRQGSAYVVDDAGAVRPEYRPVPATLGAIAPDGAVLYVRPDRVLLLCAENPVDRSECRELGVAPGGVPARIVAQSGSAGGAGRFLLLNGPADGTRLVDPERPINTGLPMPRTEAALRACLQLHGLSMLDQTLALFLNSLAAEASDVGVAAGERINDWQFFHVVPDEYIYVPVLEFARQENTFPSSFETLQELGGTSTLHQTPEAVLALYDKYLRLDLEARRKKCTIYFRTQSMPGSWLIEYWLYYPFDVGGLGSHLHDPEHLFVEVDKLGGTVHRVMGAGHGFVAGNNIFTTARPSAMPAALPLFAMVELAKHATATDMDRDGVFTPGVDENEYRERAKIWGVRDVIGTINNQLMAYDRTMSAPRWPEDSLASVEVTSRFPHEPSLAARACCRLVPMPAEPPPVLACHGPSADCARSTVMFHPDYLAKTAILKEWVFPQSFLRLTYGLGPGQRLHSLGVGYTVDLDRAPGLGRLLPMPGRVGAEVFAWKQGDVTVPDPDACVRGCLDPDGFGVGVRYEQFLSNLFGIYSGIRIYSVPLSDVWITFGPIVEVPVVNRGNVSLLVGLAFRPTASPRFEMKVNVGIWKRRVAYMGIRAAKGGRP